MPRLGGPLALLLVLAQAPWPAWAQPLPESAWADAAAPFDHIPAGGRIIADDGSIAQAPPYRSSASLKTRALDLAASPKPALLGASSTRFDVAGIGTGQGGAIGPVLIYPSSYAEGLLGGLLGLVLAPLALAVEVACAVVLTPIRMIKGLAEGDYLAALEPVRTVKNLVQDVVMTTAGMLNCATAPVWNAIDNEHMTDFAFANDRLVFMGGPMAKLTGMSEIAPSWHTVFLKFPQYPVDHHEFTHNKQWEKSFGFGPAIWQHGEDFDKADPNEYLNL